MVVEDHWLTALALEFALREAGCEVVGPVAGFDEAKDLAADGQIEAALLDVNLGDETSFPIADLLMARAIPFAFATAFSGGNLPSRFVDCTLLSKPFDLNALMVVIRTLLAATATA
jgi:DNA-binding response OmpR family regulator